MASFWDFFRRKQAPRSAAVAPAPAVASKVSSETKTVESATAPVSKFVAIARRAKQKPAPIDAATVTSLLKKINDVVVNYMERINPKPKPTEFRVTHYIKRLFSCNGQKFFCGAKGRRRADEFANQLNSNKLDDKKLLDVCNFAYKEQSKAYDSFLAKEVLETIATELNINRGPRVQALDPYFYADESVLDSRFYAEVNNTVTARINVKGQLDEKQPSPTLRLKGN